MLPSDLCNFEVTEWALDGKVTGDLGELKRTPEQQQAFRDLLFATPEESELLHWKELQDHHLGASFGLLLDQGPILPQPE